MSVRVRFAPSPTGHVHIGNIRAAIFNWLFARHEGGKFLLRIEDTDRERSTPEAVKAVLDAMEWLGLNWDEEPMCQSTRQAAHVAAAGKLLAGGHAYREDKGGLGKGECVVFRAPGTDVTFHDEIKGDLTKKADDLKDFVIVRSDGTPVFHLANVADDIEMGITHIIRGDDHIENTYRHVLLFKALGAEPPRYAHLPMIVNQQGKPYSKRDGAAFVGEFREKGYLAAALFNYLALLGWSPGGDLEKMSRNELIERFTLDRVRSSPGQMDLKKLTHMNAQYVAELPMDDFSGAVRQAIGKKDWAAGIDENLFLNVCRLMQSRTHTLVLAEEWKYFFSEELDYEEKAVEKNLRKPGVGDTLRLVRSRLAGAEFTDAGVEQAIHAAEQEAGIQPGKFNQPIRIAITGRSTGAGLYETAVLLGKDRTLKRLDSAVEKFNL